ncbi:bacteriocin immunity protein [Enterococcus sp. AZ109]|uniref:bacteriocin immunity protein n=1 Tax=Enterococcus sp. AZ109 TaxID=2774634 RepID=UPI003F29AAAE
MKKKDLEKNLLIRINDLLELNLSNNERSALNRVKTGLEKSSYFPGVVDDLRNELTPLAIRSLQFIQLIFSSNEQYLNLVFLIG